MSPITTNQASALSSTSSSSSSTVLHKPVSVPSSSYQLKRIESRLELLTQSLSNSSLKLSSSSSLSSSASNHHPLTNSIIATTTTAAAATANTTANTTTTTTPTTTFNGTRKPLTKMVLNHHYVDLSTAKVSKPPLSNRHYTSHYQASNKLKDIISPKPSSTTTGTSAVSTSSTTSSSTSSTSSSNLGTTSITPPTTTTNQNFSSCKYSLHDFELGRILGKGKLGKVYCAKHIKSGYVVALKVMSKQDLIELKLEKNLRREIEIQCQLIHPHISKLYGYFFDHKNIYLILEYSMGGELYNHLKILKKFDNIKSSYYIYQLSLALNYLHSKHIIHRDIKPENILLSDNNIIKLSDFGWSVITSHQKQKRLTICGTLDYLSPEMIESSQHDYKVDIWSLGILIYEFLVGKPPFEEIDKNATYKRIVKIDLKFPDFIDSDAKDLIINLLQKNPKSRLNLNQVLNHAWILKYKPYWPTS